jgi:hypothetical protein
MVEWHKNQRFEGHLCPRPQDNEVAGVPIRVIYIRARVPCSWLSTSQWGLVGGVKCSPCFAQLSDWITCSSQDNRPGSTWNHRLCWSFRRSIAFQLLPSRGSPCNLLSYPTRRVLLKSMWCPVLKLCSATVDLSGYLKRMCLICSLHLTSIDLPVWPTYTLHIHMEFGTRQGPLDLSHPWPAWAYVCFSFMECEQSWCCI